MDLTEKLHKSKYYVYEHYLDDKLFYIGKGTGNRCFNFKSRSNMWKEKTKNRTNEIKL